MAIKLSYWSYQMTVFCSMYLGYTLFHLNRKSFSFAMPAVIEEQGLDKDDLGLIMSSQLLAYTFSKFLGGLAADVFSSRLLFCGGLFLSGLIVLLFTLFESVTMYAILWFALGLAQGGGWPACGKILRQWFAPEELGTWWSVLSTAMNMACSVGPLLTTAIIVEYGWRGSMQIYGTAAIAMVAVCMISIVDSPEDIGLTAPHASMRRDDKGRRTGRPHRGSWVDQMARELQGWGKPRGRGRGSWHDLLRSPLMWVLCCSYCVVFAVRTAVQDWGQLYLIQNRSQTPYMASIFLSSLEMGGIIGSVVAGFLGDAAVSMSRRDNMRGSPRMYVVMGFLSVAMVALHMIIFTIKPDTSEVWIILMGFVFGFGIYGPIAVYGVMAIESAPSHLSGTSHATVALAANIGGVMAGLPLSYVAQVYDWSGAFFMLEVFIGAILILKILTRHLEYKMVPIKKKLQ